MTTTAAIDIRSIAFNKLLATVSGRIEEAFRPGGEGAARALEGRRHPAFAELGASQALACFVPVEYGGRAEEQKEILSLLEAVSYHSLALGLTIGINGGLFLIPLAKYGSESVKRRVFPRFVEEGALGGLMLTEPEYGTDVLSMRSSFERRDGRYEIAGTKHWAGLTGIADFWLLTARERKEGGALKRDIDFFVCDSREAGQRIEVEEYYPALGLEPIPYGRNKVEVSVPLDQRLEVPGSGIRLLLDLLHRSRMSFGGMAIGFIRRLFDDGLDRCRERRVGGKSLLAYDQVVRRLAETQAAHTISAAFCRHASANSGIELDLSGEGLAANIHKAVLTDLMHEASQSFLQLSGAQGFRHDARAGRALVDSRPYQIFEGSNDVLYDQIAGAFLKAQAEGKESSLRRFLGIHRLTRNAVGQFPALLGFDPGTELPQRKMVDLGKILSGVVSVDFLVGLGSAGYSTGLVENAIALLRSKIDGLAAGFSDSGAVGLVEDYAAGLDWQACAT